MTFPKTLLILGVVVVGAFALLTTPDVHKDDKKFHLAKIDSPQIANPSELILESKIDMQGSVTIEVIPLDVSAKTSEWKFDVGLNTHSLDLSEDMTDVSKLVDDKGNEYAPIRWEGSDVGGHHREGFLIFKSITPMPKSIELKIINIEVPIRSFIWDITS